jgi:hypothetical protein
VASQPANGTKRMSSRFGPNASMAICYARGSGLYAGIFWIDQRQVMITAVSLAEGLDDGSFANGP